MSSTRFAGLLLPLWLLSAGCVLPAEREVWGELPQDREARELETLELDWPEWFDPAPDWQAQLGPEPGAGRRLGLTPLAEGEEFPAGVSLWRSPWQPRLTPRRSAPPNRPRTRSTSLQLGWTSARRGLPAAAWLQRRSAVDPLPLHESPQIGQLLGGGVRGEGQLPLTGLLTSDEGPALTFALRHDF